MIYSKLQVILTNIDQSIKQPKCQPRFANFVIGSQSALMQISVDFSGSWGGFLQNELDSYSVVLL